MEGKKSNVKHAFLESGILLSGMAYLGNQAMGIANSRLFTNNQLWITAGICLGGGIFLDWFFRDSDIEKLFRACGIENKGKQVPIVMKKTISGNQTTLVLNVPEGLSQSHFEEKQEELEQNLNAKIEFGFNKNLIMKLTEKTLSSMYNYVFEEQDSPTKIYCGNTHASKFVLDLEDCPHAIIAGETRSGKTSLATSVILSLILSKHDVQLHLVDFQAAGLGKFEDCKKVKSYCEKPSDFDKLLNELESESERRLKLYKSVKNKIYIEKLSEWNKHFPDKYLPPIIVIIDEFARLNEKSYDEIHEKFRDRISSDAKAGISYIASMQRPDVTVITGSTKANMPTRIAFKVVSEVDSKVILDQSGAERIKEKGRFLIKYCGEVTEVQALYMEPSKIRKLLTQHKAYKTKEDIEQEKREQMKLLRDKCINPYLKKG